MKVRGISFGPRAVAHEHEFMKAPVAGCLVDDVVAAREEMDRKHVYEITSRG